MVDGGDETGVEESDEWITGEAPTLEESSQTLDETSPLRDVVDDYLPYWVTWEETYYGMGVGFLIVVVGTLAVSTVATCTDASSLSSRLAEIEAASEADTFESWRGALQQAEAVRQQPPGGLSSFFHTVGFLAPGASPSSLRAEIRDAEVYTAALLAYRFDEATARRHAGPRDRAGGEDSSGRDGASSARHEAARTYDLLRRGEYADALRVAEAARQRHDGDLRLLRAHLEAALTADRATLVETLARKLGEREGLTIYDRYLLLRSARYHGAGSTSALLETFETGEKGGHVGARIEEVAMLVREGKYDKANKIGANIRGRFDATGDAEAPTGPAVQIARLRNQMGLACARLGDTECSRKHFAAARKVAADRGDVYAVQIESYLDRGDLERATELLEGAVDTAGPHDELRAARARLQFLQGRFDEALESLDRISDSWEMAPVLRARIHLALDDYEAAAAAVAEVPSSSPDANRARAVELLAKSLGASELPEGTVESMEQLTSDSEDSIVLRSAARLHLHRARSGDDEGFQKAKSLLDRVEASRHATRGVDAFLRCDVHRAAGDMEAAEEACARARRANPAFLTGMLSAVQLRLELQQPDRAALLAARLEGRFDTWEVGKARLRTAVRTHRLDLAEKLLAAWSKRKKRKHVDSGELAFFRGRVLFARANYAAALEELEKGRDSASLGDEAALFRAHALVRLGKLEKAASTLDELTDLEAWKAPAWAIYGELRRRQEEVYDALENLRIARRHFDEDRAPRWRLSHLYGQFALTWQQHRDWSDSRVAANLEKAREKGDPRSPEFAYPYGRFLLAGYGNNSEPDRAVPHLERVVSLQPYHCEAIDALHTAYEEVHDWAGRNDMRDLREKHCSE